MATMTSSATKPKTPLSTGQLSDITCNYCKEKGHMVKDCEKLKKKKEKDAQQGKQTQKKTYPECGTVVKRTNRKKDVGKVLVRISNPNAPDQMTLMTVNRIQRRRNHKKNQHLPTHRPHLPMMSQKTNFATTPIQPTNICPTIHQIGPSNANFPPIQPTIDGLSLCCLAAADGKSYHYYLQ